MRHNGSKVNGAQLCKASSLDNAPHAINNNCRPREAVSSASANSVVASSTTLLPHLTTKTTKKSVYTLMQTNQPTGDYYTLLFRLSTHKYTRKIPSNEHDIKE